MKRFSFRAAPLLAAALLAGCAQDQAANRQKGSQGQVTPSEQRTDVNNPKGGGDGVTTRGAQPDGR
jgi:PBP1b-binding outer membrane lipoprotein LpoB